MMKLSTHSFLFQFLSWCPGAIGYLLRQKFMPLYFKKCGQKIVFGRFIKINGSNKIQIGSGCVISDRVILDVGNSSDSKGNPTIELGGRSFIGVATVIRSIAGKVNIAKDVNIGSNCIINAQDNIHFGEKSLIAAYCSFGIDPVDNMNSDNSICIGDGSWLGARVKVLGGCNIGKDCVIGAHSVVSSDIPKFSIAVGQPAIVVKSRLSY